QFNLFGCSQVSDESILFIAQNCPQLKKLWLSECTRVSDASLSLIAKTCPLLEVLDLANCEKITDASVSLITQNCQHLKMLDLEGCTISDASISFIAQNCSKLQLLVLDAKLETADLMQSINTKCPCAIVFLLHRTHEGIMVDVLHTTDMKDVAKNELIEWF